jgi:hypothetical protein
MKKGRKKRKEKGEKEKKKKKFLSPAGLGVPNLIVGEYGTGTGVRYRYSFSSR